MVPTLAAEKLSLASEQTERVSGEEVRHALELVHQAEPSLVNVEEGYDSCLH